LDCVLQFHSSRLSTVSTSHFFRRWTVSFPLPSLVGLCSKFSFFVVLCFTFSSPPVGGLCSYFFYCFHRWALLKNVHSLYGLTVDHTFGYLY
jgi:hypothetical protein